MSNDPAGDARVRELLRVADDAWRMLAAGHAPPGLAEALEGVYRDLGKHLHERHRESLLRPTDSEVAETQEVPARAPWPRASDELAPPHSMAAMPQVPDIAPPEELEAPAELEPPPPLPRASRPAAPADPFDDEPFDPAALPDREDDNEEEGVLAAGKR